MTMPGRKFSSTGGYRYGFNGQENSDEIAAGLTTAMYWEYDSRIGRRWNVDPVVKVWESPYLCFSGNPIWLKDVNGDQPDGPGDEIVPDKSQKMKKDLEAAVLESKKFSIEEQKYTQGLLDTYNSAVKLILDARLKGYNEAANNLQLYLNGDDNTRILTNDFLKQFRHYNWADNRLTNYFLDEVHQKMKELKPGESLYYASNTNFAATVDACQFCDQSELYYASGESFIKGRAIIKMDRDKEGNYTLNMDIYKTWGDTYDWHKGLGIWGTSVTDGSLFELESWGAKTHLMRAYSVTTIKQSAKDLFLIGMHIESTAISTNSSPNTLNHPEINTSKGYHKQ
jgi:hypothetical protein